MVTFFSPLAFINSARALASFSKRFGLMWLYSMEFTTKAFFAPSSANACPSISKFFPVPDAHPGINTTASSCFGFSTFVGLNSFE